MAARDPSKAAVRFGQKRWEKPTGRWRVGQRCRQAVAGRVCRWPWTREDAWLPQHRRHIRPHGIGGETQTRSIMVSEGRDDGRLQVLVRMAGAQPLGKASQPVPALKIRKHFLMQKFLLTWSDERGSLERLGWVLPPRSLLATAVCNTRWCVVCNPRWVLSLGLRSPKGE